MDELHRRDYFANKVADFFLRKSSGPGDQVS